MALSMKSGLFSSRKQGVPWWPTYTWLAKLFMRDRVTSVRMLLCQNDTLLVCGAWIRIFFVLCSMAYSTHGGLFWTLLVRDGSLGAPTFMKFAYCDRAQAWSWLGAYTCMDWPSLLWIRSRIPGNWGACGNSVPARPQYGELGGGGVCEAYKGNRLFVNEQSAAWREREDSYDREWGQGNFEVCWREVTVEDGWWRRSQSCWGQIPPIRAHRTRVAVTTTSCVLSKSSMPRWRQPNGKRNGSLIR